MIIYDLDGREYQIYNMEEFKNHIKQFHTVDGKPDGSLHEENGYYFRVDKSFYDLYLVNFLKFQLQCVFLLKDD